MSSTQMRSNPCSRKKIETHLLLAFLLCFSFILFCYAGLPIDFNADHLGDIQSVNSLSYGKLVQLILSPSTPAWFFLSGTRLMGHLRPLQFLILKLYFDGFGYRLLPFHITAALGSGILAAVLLALIFYWTQSLLLGWLGVILYASFPSNFYLMASIFSLDFQYFASILSISVLSLFALLTFGRFRSRTSYVTGFLVWFLLVWLTIKLKTSEKILPLVCLAFLIVRFKFICEKIGVRRLAVVLVGILALVPIIVPLKFYPHEAKETEIEGAAVQAKPTSVKDKITFSFHWRNMLQRTFYVPGGEFPLTTVLRRKMPRSLTESLGFFLGWFFWLSLIVLPLILARLRKTGGERGTAYGHFVWIFLVWLGVTLIGFSNGLPPTELRFLNFAYVPAVFLIFLTAGAYERLFFQIPWRLFLFRFFLTMAVFYTSAANFVFLTQLIAHYGGIQDALVRAEKDVFQSFYKERPDELSLYERHAELESRAVLVDWYDWGENWLEMTKRRLADQKQLYFYTRKPDSIRLKKLEAEGIQATLWKRYDFLDARSLFFKLMKAVSQLDAIQKRLERREILIYLVRPTVSS